ncbi:hypothetical protein AURDEDRAFT_138272 [Auricularia subglabra TFB-10046 SS5]|nr:hypothetical protein AURDEDRAFT_138272 [Auricularia subglabra TFB-10046 SS5]
MSQGQGKKTRGNGNNGNNGNNDNNGNNGNNAKRMVRRGGLPPGPFYGAKNGSGDSNGSYSQPGHRPDGRWWVGDQQPLDNPRR